MTKDLDPRHLFDDKISFGHMSHEQADKWVRDVRNAEEAGSREHEKWNRVECAYANFMFEVMDATNFKFDPECVANTPGRVARLMKEMIIGEEECKRLLDAAFKTFESSTPEMIVFEDIRCTSLCPHHILPVTFKCAIGYIPNGVVIGASKFERVARAIARRPVLQEQLCWDIADAIDKRLKPKGVGVVMSGVHTCMTCRGVKSNSRMVTSAMRGVFLSEHTAKDEFLKLAGYGK